MRQLIESIIDVGSGLFLATLLQLYIFPFFGMHPSVWESFNIALIFMCSINEKEKNNTRTS